VIVLLTIVSLMQSFYIYRIRAFEGARDQAINALISRSDDLVDAVNAQQDQINALKTRLNQGHHKI